MQVELQAGKQKGCRSSGMVQGWEDQIKYRINSRYEVRFLVKVIISQDDLEQGSQTDRPPAVAKLKSPMRHCKAKAPYTQEDRSAGIYLRISSSG